MNNVIMCLGLVGILHSVGSTLRGEVKAVKTQVSIAQEVEATVLAAGRSSRFKAHGNKQLAKLCGRELLLYPLTALHELGIGSHLVLSTHGGDLRASIEHSAVDDVQFHIQQEPKGTGHAVASAQSGWTKDQILILNGDTPLVNKELITSLYQEHKQANATVTFVTSMVDDPISMAYGRVIEQDGTFRIVEQKDCSPEELQIKRVNAGIYLVERNFLEQALRQLTPSSASGEIYITDIVQRASDAKKVVSAITVPIERVLGVNKLVELVQVEKIMQADIIAYWIEQGVRFHDPLSTYVDVTVAIGAGTVIDANVHLLGETTIGTGCTIAPFTLIKDRAIAGNTRVPAFSHITRN